MARSLLEISNRHHRHGYYWLSCTKCTSSFFCVEYFQSKFRNAPYICVASCRQLTSKINPGSDWFVPTCARVYLFYLLSPQLNKFLTRGRLFSKSRHCLRFLLAYCSSWTLRNEETRRNLNWLNVIWLFSYAIGCWRLFELTDYLELFKSLDLTNWAHTRKS